MRQAYLRFAYLSYETNANLRLNYWAASTIITSSWVEELDWDNLVDESTGCRKRRA